MNNIGERLYDLRTKHDMSQGDLAEKLGVSRQTISKWENNMSVPELDKIISLSDVFCVTVDYIVKGEGENADLTPVQVSTAIYEAEQENTAVRMITVNPTKKYVMGLSVAIGTVNILLLLYSVISRINILSMSPGLADQIGSLPEFIASSVLTVLFSVALFCRKEKFISAILIIKAVFSVTDCFATFNYSATLYRASAVVGVIAAILVAAGYITANKKNARVYLWLIIGLRIVSLAVNCAASFDAFVNTIDMTVYNAVVSVLGNVLRSIPSLFISIGIAVLVYLKGNPKPTYEVPENEYPARNDMYVGIVKHILLTLFTFGIYDCIWVYKTTENLNCGGINQIQSGAKKLLLCIFVPFYRLYWFYAQAKRLETLMKEKNSYSSDFAVVTLILAIFVPIVAASAFLQVKINEYSQYSEN